MVEEFGTFGSVCDRYRRAFVGLVNSLKVSVDYIRDAEVYRCPSCGEVTVANSRITIEKFSTSELMDVVKHSKDCRFVAAKNFLGGRDG